jgi:hypothetical protein
MARPLIVVFVPCVGREVRRFLAIVEDATNLRLLPKPQQAFETYQEPSDEPQIYLELQQLCD